MKPVDRLIEVLATTPDEELRQRALDRSKVPRDTALLERITELVPIRGRIDLPQAQRLAESAEWIAASIGTDHAAGRSLRALGHVFMLEGRSEAAVVAYQAAIARFRKARRPLEEAITRSGGLQALIYLAGRTYRCPRIRNSLRYARADSSAKLISCPSGSRIWKKGADSSSLRSAGCNPLRQRLTVIVQVVLEDHVLATFPHDPGHAKVNFRASRLIGGTDHRADRKSCG